MKNKDNIPKIFDESVNNTIIFDCDGVICDDRENLPYNERKPYPFVKEYLDKIKEFGYRIIILTARYMVREDGDQQKATRRGKKELIEWLEKWELPYDDVYLGKPPGFIYVDDKAWNIQSNSKDYKNIWETLINTIKK